MPRLTLLLPVLLAVALTSCDLMGLDLHSPTDAREFARRGARGHDAIYFKALNAVLQNTSGPATILVPNMGDQEVRAQIEADLRQQNLNPRTFLGSEAADRLARANIFLLSHLTTGQHATLDGKVHSIKCGAPNADGVNTCQIDGLIEATNKLGDDGPLGANGSVYATFGRESGSRAYLPF